MKNKTACLVLSISQSIYAIFLLAWAISVFFTIVLLPEDEYDTGAPGVFYTIRSYRIRLYYLPQRWAAGTAITSYDSKRVTPSMPFLYFGSFRWGYL
ncbi:MULTISPECIES: hypothetical protein [Bacillales]|uniref:hypothetical protein n=1 Tax=Bacillales TaxID=1385 RepID=UPI00036CF0B2|nr:MULTISPECIES: hypothetical protein [Bacillales]KMZ44447.1 hypothetical protein AC624_27015 [Bacillus sp. FJAT-27238]